MIRTQSVDDVSAFRLTGAVVPVAEVLAYINGDSFLTRHEAAKFLRISIRRLDLCKDLPRYRLPGDSGNGRVLFKRSELIALLVREYPVSKSPDTTATEMEPDHRNYLDRLADNFRAKFNSKMVKK